MLSGNNPQAQENIKLNNYDLRPHFAHVYNAVIKEVPDNCYVGDRVLDSKSLNECFSKKYPNKKYALLFYAHKPFSPQYNSTDKAHTSLLLCAIENGEINPNKVINIDGYHFLPYVDILGESHTTKIQAQNKIKKRIVICSKVTERNSPIQAPSWGNMNCALFAVHFAKSLLAMIFKGNTSIIDDELNSCKDQGQLPNSTSLFSHGENGLVSAIIDELIANKIYFQRSERGVVFNAKEALDYHTQVRLDISTSYVTKKLSEQKTHEFSSALPLTLSSMSHSTALESKNDPIPSTITDEIKTLSATLDNEIKSINASCFSFFLSYKAATKQAKRDYLTTMLEAKTLTALTKMASDAKTNKRVMHGIISSRVSNLINDIVDRPGAIFFRKFT